MKKQLVSLVFHALFLNSCQSTYSARAVPDPLEPSADRTLWNDYVKDEVGSDSIRTECMPRFVPANAEVGRQGLVMFFHGFTSCPQEFSVLSARLSQAGFDVFLPLLPGHGRTADVQAEDRRAAYPRFVEKMNEIARRAPRGDKVLAGLSGGGTLATEAALTGPAIWDRILLYAPRVTESLSKVDKIQVPLQFVGVHHEEGAVEKTLQNALKNRRNARLCFYPDGVPHAMLRGASSETDADAYWLPALEEDSLAFITRGRWFITLREAACRYTL